LVAAGRSTGRLARSCSSPKDGRRPCLADHGQAAGCRLDGSGSSWNQQRGANGDVTTRRGMAFLRRGATEASAVDPIPRPRACRVREGAPRAPIWGSSGRRPSHGDGGPGRGTPEDADEERLCRVPGHSMALP
jgi:hypothetical protein